jgi:hypothetical protein
MFINKRKNGFNKIQIMNFEAHSNMMIHNRTQ